MEIELQILRALCNGIGADGQRRDLVRMLDHYVFIEPEHHVVFESIRLLLPRGPISLANLTVHLNNRGFPDMDVENYFRAPSTSFDVTLQRARELPPDKPDKTPDKQSIRPGKSDSPGRARRSC